MQFPSKLVEEAVDQISRLPGIGKKTALRLVLHFLKQDKEYASSISQAITKLRNEIQYCKQCFDISDGEICRICSGIKRDHSMICVVEDSPDVIAIENTNQYQGLYHVLGGVISPIDGIGPSELKLNELFQRVEHNQPEVEEVILALSPTMEGDTTSFYITKKLKPLGIRVTTIARGIPIGGELEYADEITLGRSIMTRSDLSED
ncbi:MAG: recombination mediator RecR [Bacteroidota bacterium]